MSRNEIRIPLFDFVNIARKEPEKQLSDARIKHYASIYAAMGKERAIEQANRCIDCGTPYCSWQCPVHNHIPEWLHLVAEGQWEQACVLSHQTNSLPEMCGRLCPQERLCEGACTLNLDYGAVTIGAIEQYITDRALNNGWLPDLSRVTSLNKRVAVVGAGPAGLACADVLIRNGVAVTVFDKYPEIGGLLTFGIPEFKLEKKVVLRRRTVFEQMGVKFKLNTLVGKDIMVEELLTRFDAVFLGLGADKSREVQSKGSELPGIIYPLSYLIDNIEVLMHYKKKRQFDFKGKRVLVLGAGDTAMDCNRTAIRQGAKTVTCVYRRGKEELPGSSKEVKHAIEEGVQFLWHHQVLEFQGHNRIEGVVLEQTDVCPKGRIVPRWGGEVCELKADAVIIAYGFSPDPPRWLKDLRVGFDANRRIIIKEDGSTACPNVYAGGDMVLGADLVVTAIAQGRKAAQGMLRDFGA